MKIIRVLIVDDSIVIHTVLKSMFAKYADFNIIYCAKDGQEAVDMVPKLQPDIVLMDIMMPGLDGIAATEKIMQTNPVPIVIFSTLLNKEAKETACKALAAGAVGVVPKQNIDISSSIVNEGELVKTLHALSEVHVFKRKHLKKESAVNYIQKAILTNLQVIGLGVSTGGPQVLAQIARDLKPNFPIPIVIVIHIMEGMLFSLIDYLNSCSNINIKVAKDGEVLAANTIYFAPDNIHTTIVKRNNLPVVCLDDSPAVNHFKPAINKLFQSLGDNFPRQAAGGILTGMGEDGALGLLNMRNNSCVTFAQSPGSCVVSSMPEAAINNGATDVVVDIGHVASFLNDLT